MAYLQNSINWKASSCILALQWLSVSDGNHFTTGWKLPGTRLVTSDTSFHLRASSTPDSSKSSLMAHILNATSPGITEPGRLWYMGRRDCHLVVEREEKGSGVMGSLKRSSHLEEWSALSKTPPGNTCVLGWNIDNRFVIIQYMYVYGTCIYTKYRRACFFRMDFIFVNWHVYEN